jgi:hypothetical protein
MTSPKIQQSPICILFLCTMPLYFHVTFGARSQSIPVRCQNVSCEVQILSAAILLGEASAALFCGTKHWHRWWGVVGRTFVPLQCIRFTAFPRGGRRLGLVLLVTCVLKWYTSRAPRERRDALWESVAWLGVHWDCMHCCVVDAARFSS